MKSILELKNDISNSIIGSEDMLKGLRKDRFKYLYQIKDTETKIAILKKAFEVLNNGRV